MTFKFTLISKRVLALACNCGLVVWGDSAHRFGGRCDKVKFTNAGIREMSELQYVKLGDY